MNLQDFVYASEDGRRRAIDLLSATIDFVSQREDLSVMERNAVQVFSDLLHRWRVGGPFDFTEDAPRDAADSSFIY